MKGQPLFAVLLLVASLGAALPALSSPPPSTEDAAKFAAAVQDSLLAADGFTVRFVAHGPGNFHTSGELSMRRPMKIRIDTEAGGVPLSWIKNGPRVFLLLDGGATDRIFHLPDAVHETCRIGPLPNTPEEFDNVVTSFLRARGAQVRKDETGYELAGSSSDSGESFRFSFDPSLRPNSFTVTSGGRQIWEIHFTDFRATAPASGRFEANARQVFDLYR